MNVQYQAALAITGAWQGSNCSKLNEELGWETLSDRRMSRRILQIHKMMTNKTTSYLKGNYLLITDLSLIYPYLMFFVK